MVSIRVMSGRIFQRSYMRRNPVEFKNCNYFLLFNLVAMSQNKFKINCFINFETKVTGTNNFCPQFFSKHDFYLLVNIFGAETLSSKQ